MAGREFTVGSRPQVVWGWLVILDFFLAGSGSGLFILSLIMGYPLGMAVALVLVLLGGSLLLVDLTRPTNAWRVIMRPQSSWLSRGTISIMVFTILGIVHVISLTASAGGSMATVTTWANVPGWEKILAIISGLAAATVALYPGFLLGSMRGIPLWSSVLSPALFLSSALIAGLGVALLLPLGANSLRALIALQVAGIGFILLQFLLLLSLLFTAQVEATKTSVLRLTQGDLKTPFYLGLLLFGLITPLGFLLISLATLGTSTLPLASGILLLIGQLMLRHILVKAGIFVSPV